MIAKKTMIQELGEEELILPTLVNNALAANDRVKYYFTLLQAARLHASHPGSGVSHLRTEREAAGVEDPAFDRVVAGSEKAGKGRWRIPHATRILSGIRSSLSEMTAPLLISKDAQSESFGKRLKTLDADIPSEESDIIEDEVIQRITAGDEGTVDSIHLLVMDLHRALNVLQGDLASEIIDGAMTYLLSDDDRDLVTAFMAGIKKTAPLKFDHPGLGDNGYEKREETCHPERYRNDRCPCPCGECGGAYCLGDLYRYPYAPSPVLPGSVRSTGNGMGGHALEESR